MHDLAHEFTSRKISPWGGIKFFQQTYERSGTPSMLSSLDLPQPGSNRGYNPVEIVEGFLTSEVLGARRISHMDWLRADEVLREIFKWDKGMASASTLCRFFNKFDLERSDRVFVELQRRWFEQIDVPQRMTIDVESTVITRYGNQELAEIGYNPTRRGRPSHHPLMAFAAEMKMVVNAWQRSGDSADALQADEFIDELFEILNRDRIGLIRMDSGFYSDKIMNLLEGNGNPEKAVDYIVRAKLTSRLLEEVFNVRKWVSDGDVIKGASYGELTYQGSKWKTARKIIVVRTSKEVVKEIQANLFKEEDLFKQYDYKVFVTNVKMSPTVIHHLYNQRGDCENRIKELKYDYGIDGFALQSFGAMEAAFRFVMLAYNLMALFKQIVMVNSAGRRLSTLRFQCIAIGSYLVKSGRNKKLKLAAEGKRRHFLEHFFSNLELLKAQFQFSSA
ncbi:MAG: IS1380 family transposase [Lewinellaceae bacterium]|nr:IS1380 family transposase [Saprospiraceae bacterium]MCB9313275.1 IS1380 family transposase [Lewinellaceae bacterium]